MSFNTAYLTLLVDSFKKCQRNNPLPGVMYKLIDDEVRSLYLRVMDELIRLTRTNKKAGKQYFKTKNADQNEMTQFSEVVSVYDTALVDLLGVNLCEAQKH